VAASIAADNFNENSLFYRPFFTYGFFFCNNKVKAKQAVDVLEKCRPGIKGLDEIAHPIPRVIALSGR
jgi:hypothetical protein